MPRHDMGIGGLWGEGASAYVSDHSVADSSPDTPSPACLPLGGGFLSGSLPLAIIPLLRVFLARVTVRVAR